MRIWKSKIIHLIIGFAIILVLTLFVLPKETKYFSYLSIFGGCLYVSIMTGPKGYFYAGLLALIVVLSEFISLLYFVLGSFDKLMKLESQNILFKVYLIELAFGILGGLVGSFIRTSNIKKLNKDIVP